jgi:hypothetical protein
VVAVSDPNPKLGDTLTEIGECARAMPNRAPPPPTLGQLHAAAPRWIWLHCRGTGCHHKQPAALAAFVIRWGADASSDLLRQCMVCKECGHKGADLYHPSWGDSATGWQPFPADQLDYANV